VTEHRCLAAVPAEYEDYVDDHSDPSEQRPCLAPPDSAQEVTPTQTDRQTDTHRQIHTNTTSTIVTLLSDQLRRKPKSQL